MIKEDFNIIFERWKNKDLLTWIKDYEEKFYADNEELNNDKKQFFDQVYKGSENIRSYFYNNYLIDMSNNLNVKSDKNIYQYTNFFKQITPTRKKGYRIYKNEKIEYYDSNDEDDINTNEKLRNKEYNKSNINKNNYEKINDNEFYIRKNNKVYNNRYDDNEGEENDNEEKIKYKNDKKNNSLSYKYYRTNKK